MRKGGCGRTKWRFRLRQDSLLSTPLAALVHQMESCCIQSILFVHFAFQRCQCSTDRYPDGTVIVLLSARIMSSSHSCRTAREGCHENRDRHQARHSGDKKHPGLPTLFFFSFSAVANLNRILFAKEVCRHSFRFDWRSWGCDNDGWCTSDGGIPILSFDFY